MEDPRPYNEQDPGPEPADELDNDPVNTPHHYRLKSGRELFDVIEEVVDDPESYHLGNIYKYTKRNGKKDPEKEIEDLQKARRHLDRLIEYKERTKKCP